MNPICSIAVWSGTRKSLRQMPTPVSERGRPGGCLRHPGMGKIGYKVMVWILVSHEKAGKIVERSHSLPRIHEQLLLHFRA